MNGRTVSASHNTVSSDFRRVAAFSSKTALLLSSVIFETVRSPQKLHCCCLPSVLKLSIPSETTLLLSSVCFQTVHSPQKPYCCCLLSVLRLSILLRNHIIAVVFSLFSNCPFSSETILLLSSVCFQTVHSPRKPYCCCLLSVLRLSILLRNHIIAVVFSLL